jgi:hypothetical protein
MWNTKSKTERVVEDTTPKTCAVCKKDAEQTLYVNQNYITTIIGLSLFPTKKEILIRCSACKRIGKVKDSGSSTLDGLDFSELKQTGVLKWRYFTFWIFLAFLAMIPLAIILF